MSDWSVVMSRPDLTLEEKRKSWAEQCARRGKKPFGDEFPAKGRRA